MHSAPRTFITVFRGVEVDETSFEAYASSVTGGQDIEEDERLEHAILHLSVFLHTNLHYVRVFNPENGDSTAYIMPKESTIIDWDGVLDMDTIPPPPNLSYPEALTILTPPNLYRTIMANDGIIYRGNEPLTRAIHRLERSSGPSTDKGRIDTTSDLDEPYFDERAGGMASTSRLDKRPIDEIRGYHLSKGTEKPRAIKRLKPTRLLKPSTTLDKGMAVPPASYMLTHIDKNGDIPSELLARMTGSDNTRTAAYINAIRNPVV